MELGGKTASHLNVARDLKENETFFGDFAPCVTKVAASGKPYTYVVIRTNHSADGEYLVFPRNVICNEKFDPDTEVRPATFTRKGGNLQVRFS